jgi:TRAP-type C4-dicarboxylate transport system permease small subunit
LQLPLPWIEELARYVMILMVFIMSGVAIYQRSHLIVEIFDALLKPKPLFYLDKFRSATAIVFSLCFTLLTLKYFLGVVETGQVSPALRISMSIPLSALLIGGVIMTINSVYMLFFGRPQEQSSEMRNS